MTYLTVGELMDRLMEFDQDAPVYIRIQTNELEDRKVLARDITEEETEIVGQLPPVIVDAWE